MKLSKHIYMPNIPNTQYHIWLQVFLQKSPDGNKIITGNISGYNLLDS